MRKRLAAGAFMAIVVLSGPGALAHRDPTFDAQRCDDGARAGHDHHHTSANDQNIGGPESLYLHEHSGHYQLRGTDGYLEIVGGQGYNGPDGTGGQGGWAQGEIDNGVVDADFHVALYGPDGPGAPNPDEDPSTRACVNAQGSHNNVNQSVPLPDLP